MVSWIRFFDVNRYSVAVYSPIAAVSDIVNWVSNIPSVGTENVFSYITRPRASAISILTGAPDNFVNVLFFTIPATIALSPGR